jgi:hypothetical protein
MEEDVEMRKLFGRLRRQEQEVVTTDCGPDLHQIAIDTLATKGTPFATALAMEIDRGRQHRAASWDELDGTPGPHVEDTTRPATLDEYVQWLRGYIKRGGSPTHYRDHSFVSGDMRYADADVTIDSDREFGARSRSIILAPGVNAIRTNPHGAFFGWGHSKVYSMDRFRLVTGSVVPAYSDPEIESLLTSAHLDKRAAQRAERDCFRRYR